MYVLFLTDRVFQDRMAPQDPKEFQAVTEQSMKQFKQVSLVCS